MTSADGHIIPFQTDRGKALKEKLLALRDIQPCLSANYLVQGWLGAGGLGVLYGPSNSGKTFVTVDLALHVSSGNLWRGQKVKSGPVIYVAAEGGGGIRNRVSAIRVAKPALMAGADFYLLPRRV